MLKSGELLGHARAFAEDPLGTFTRFLDTFPNEEVVRARFGPFMDYGRDRRRRSAPAHVGGSWTGW